MRDSIWAVASGGAERPDPSLILKPLYKAGLWLAVIMNPHGERCATTDTETAGVGIGLDETWTEKPWARRSDPTVLANSLEKKRRSYPTRSAPGCVGRFF